jgi:hypothetical protein
MYMYMSQRVCRSGGCTHLQRKELGTRDEHRVVLRVELGCVSADEGPKVVVHQGLLILNGSAFVTANDRHECPGSSTGIRITRSLLLTWSGE